jgi:hypothetical protein
MNLSEELMTNQTKESSSSDDVEIKKRFRILLKEGIEIANRNEHNMRIEKIKLEETHMWASLVCKRCGGTLYLDADRKWHKDKIFGTAALIQCKG